MRLTIRFEVDPYGDDEGNDLFDDDDFTDVEDGTAKCGWNGLSSKCVLSVERGTRRG